MKTYLSRPNARLPLRADVKRLHAGSLGASTAFVSAGYYYPSNGMGGADTICTSEAAAAGLPGTYRAFLATTQASGMSRFGEGGAPWVRVDGVVLAATGTVSFACSSDRSSKP
jgi:hypothetical protein